MKQYRIVYTVELSPGENKTFYGIWVSDKHFAEGVLKRMKAQGYTDSQIEEREV